MLAELTVSGNVVEVWTICAGDPPPGLLSPLVQSLHKRWGMPANPMETRREEDRRSCALLGAGVRHFSIPDCIYRRNPVTGGPLIRENSELFQPLPDVEQPLAKEIQQQLENQLPPQAKVVSPLGLGGHIDHHLVRRAAEGLNKPLLYYPEYPYAVRSQDDLTRLLNPDWKSLDFFISIASLRKWQTAVAAHESQISTFWRSTAEMKSAIESYWRSVGGSRLWGNPVEDIHNKTAN